jgi:hypothetical protein
VSRVATTIGPWAALVLTLAGAGALRAQSGLAQLGLTDAAARTFVLDEFKAEQADRRSRIAIFGQRAFYKLAPAARGPAATALFAWAKGYVSSPAFAASYAEFRKNANPVDTSATPDIDAAVQAQIDEMLAGVEEWKKVAATLKPADQARMLDNIRQQEALARSPEFASKLRAGLAAEHVEKRNSDSDSARQFNERYPADPMVTVARRLREFLAATADVNFAARTIHLTGGADGIELVDPADRARPWMWQAAAIVGPDATGAARAAATAWLAELER